MSSRRRRGEGEDRFHTYNLGGVPIEDNDIIEDDLRSEDEGEPARRHYRPQLPDARRRGDLAATPEPPGESLNEDGSTEYKTANVPGRVQCSDCGAYVIPTDSNCCSMCGASLGNTSVRPTIHELATQQKVDLKVCPQCHTGISASDAKFCPNCGASIQETVSEPPVIKQDAIPEASVLKKGKLGLAKRGKRRITKSEDCMVCHLAFNKDDDIVWCPYCGNSAHRNHLLEWIQLRHHCPVCNEFLEERALQS